MKEYEINGHKWKFYKSATDVTTEIWHSYWWCPDGDGVELYINLDDFQLSCFSGIGTSMITIDELDFNALWHMRWINGSKQQIPLPEIESIGKYTHHQQCIIIADYLCSLFCEYNDLTGYKQS